MCLWSFLRYPLSFLSLSHHIPIIFHVGSPFAFIPSLAHVSPLYQPRLSECCQARERRLFYRTSFDGYYRSRGSSRYVLMVCVRLLVHRSFASTFGSDRRSLCSGERMNERNPLLRGGERLSGPGYSVVSPFFFSSPSTRAIDELR